jgi:hypothetical protein
VSSVVASFYTDMKTVLVHDPAAKFRFGGIDVGAIALGVDQRVHRVLRGGAVMRKDVTSLAPT